MTNIVLILVPVLALAFLAVGALCAVLAFQSQRGTLPYLSWMGLRIAEVRSSPDNWSHAHRAVWPLFALGAAISFFHGLALIPASLMTDIGAGSYVAVITIAGLVVIIALWLLAGKAARHTLSGQ